MIEGSALLISVVKSEAENVELNVFKVDCAKFVKALKVYYSDNIEVSEHIKNLVIDGNESFSVIRNIPNVEVDGKKLISILTEDLIKLLYK